MNPGLNRPDDVRDAFDKSPPEPAVASESEELPTLPPEGQLSLEDLEDEEEEEEELAENMDILDKEGPADTSET